jgi:DNA (cytosine-5)-methyltransferase 1
MGTATTRAGTIMNEKPIRVVSLFSGCGGMDLGILGGFEFNGRRYRKLATEIVHSSDFDERVIKIFNQNFEHQASVLDVRNLKGSSLPRFDILTGGFPCQSFSISAQNPKRLGYRDDRGQLFFEIKRLLLETRPQAFIAENVKGLLSANKREAFPLIIREFEDAGYQVHWTLLNASHYGVPQKRERVFIVGFRNKTASNRFEFPRPTTVNQPVPLRLVLEDNRLVDENFYFSNRAVQGMRNTKNSRSMNKGRAQDPTQPCNTVSSHLAKVSLNSTDPVLFVNNRYRMFTPREVARIQSFPDSFKLECPKSVAYYGLGNAVPPVLMWHVSQAVIKALRPTSNR